MSSSNPLSVLCLQCNCQFDNVFLYQRHVEKCHSNEVPPKTATGSNPPKKKQQQQEMKIPKPSAQYTHKSMRMKSRNEDFEKQKQNLKEQETKAKKSDQEMKPKKKNEKNYNHIFENWHDAQCHSSQKSLLPVKCEFCNMVFYNVNDLRKHVVLHTRIPPFQCGICEKVLLSASSLKRHILGQHPLSDLSCKVLEGDFAHPKSFPCKSCDSNVKSFNDLQSHIVNKHLQVFKQSPDVTKESLLTEEKTCVEMPTHTANEVLKHIDRRVKKRRLTKKKPLGQMRTCEYCNKTMDRSNLPRHRKTHKRNELKHTDRQLTKEEQLLLTQNSVTCEYCNKTMDRSNLSRHLKYHRRNELQQPSEKARQTCKLCGLTVFASYLSKHMRTHLVKEFLCHICGVSFNLVKKLNRHMVIHGDSFPFVCEDCGVRKRSKAALRKHQFVHSGERPFKCQYCGKGITFKYDLIRHEQRHRGELLYSCPHCPISFKTKYSLKKHLAKEQHRPNVSDREEEQQEDDRSNRTIEEIPKTTGKHQSEESIDSEGFHSQDEEIFADTKSEVSNCIDYADDSEEANKLSYEEWVPTKQRKVQTGRLDTIESMSPHLPTSSTDHVTSWSDDSDLNEASSNTDNHDSETTSSDTVAHGVTIKQEPGLDEYESMSPHVPTSPTDHVDSWSNDSDLNEASSNTDDHDSETTSSNIVPDGVTIKQEPGLDEYESMSPHLFTSPTNHVSSSTEDHDSETTSSNIVGDGPQSTEDIVTIKREPGLDVSEVHFKREPGLDVSEETFEREPGLDVSEETFKREPGLDVSEAFEIPFTTIMPSSLNP